MSDFETLEITQRQLMSMVDAAEGASDFLFSPDNLPSGKTHRRAGQPGELFILLYARLMKRCLYHSGNIIAKSIELLKSDKFSRLEEASDGIYPMQMVPNPEILNFELEAFLISAKIMYESKLIEKLAENFPEGVVENLRNCLITRY